MNLFIQDKPDLRLFILNNAKQLDGAWLISDYWVRPTASRAVHFLVERPEPVAGNNTSLHSAPCAKRLLSAQAYSRAQISRISTPVDHLILMRHAQIRAERNELCY